MSTFDLVCVTNRALCADDFIARIGTLAQAGIDRIILREKDLSEHAYLTLARQALDAGGDRVVLHLSLIHILRIMDTVSPSSLTVVRVPSSPVSSLSS